MDDQNPYTPPAAPLNDNDDVPDLAKTSPYSPANLFRLFFKPGHFFADLRFLGRRPELMLTIWMMGITSCMDQIDKRLVRAELGRASAGWEQSAPYILDSWLNYWLAVLVFGVLYGAVRYYVLGWWYKKRLHWSGDPHAAQPDARRAFVYQELVMVAPYLLVLIIQTFLYPNYRAVWEAEEWLSATLIIFLIWSIWTSYAAATTAFVLRPWPARFWFIVLPALYYISIVGFVGVLYALISE